MHEYVCSGAFWKHSPQENCTINKYNTTVIPPFSLLNHVYKNNTIACRRLKGALYRTVHLKTYSYVLYNAP